MIIKESIIKLPTFYIKRHCQMGKNRRKTGNMACTPTPAWRGLKIKSLCWKGVSRKFSFWWGWGWGVGGGGGG